MAAGGRKWVGRHRAERELGLLDRSSTPVAASSNANGRVKNRVRATITPGVDRAIDTLARRLQQLKP